MLTIYKKNDYLIWNNLLKTFDNHDIYYYYNYLKAFELNGDGEPLLIYYENKDFKAVNAVFKRDIALFEPFQDKIEKGKFFDLVTPYGYGGWLIENETQNNHPINVNQLKQEYTDWCNTNQIIDEFVRFHPINKNYEHLSHMYESAHCGNTVCIDTASEKVIWENILSKNRNMIRKAQKSGIQIKTTREPFIIKPFIDIYNETMRNDNAEEYYYFKESFYQSIREDLKDNALWFYAELDNEIIASAIFLFCNENMHYHLSAGKREYRQFAPTNLILYEAAQWASKHGYKKLHLGGGLGSKEDNLYKFKKSFMKGPDTEFWIGKKIFNKKVYDELVRLRQKLAPNFNNESSFFPKYRAN